MITTLFKRLRSDERLGRILTHDLVSCLRCHSRLISNRLRCTFERLAQRFNRIRYVACFPAVHFSQLMSTSCCYKWWNKGRKAVWHRQVKENAFFRLEEDRSYWHSIHCKVRFTRDKMQATGKSSTPWPSFLSHTACLSQFVNRYNNNSCASCWVKSANGASVYSK
jgi:hypothetical protein